MQKKRPFRWFAFYLNDISEEVLLTSGYFNCCGDRQVGRIPFDEQIRNFQNTLDQITGNLGADSVASAIARCLFFVGMGSNDYLNNYLMPNYDTRNHFNGQQFADLLVQQYTRQLTVRSTITILMSNLAEFKCMGRFCLNQQVSDVRKFQYCRLYTILGRGSTWLQE